MLEIAANRTLKIYFHKRQLKNFWSSIKAIFKNCYTLVNFGRPTVTIRNLNVLTMGNDEWGCFSAFMCLFCSLWPKCVIVFLFMCYPIIKKIVQKSVRQRFATYLHYLLLIDVSNKTYVRNVDAAAEFAFWHHNRIIF